MVSATLRASRRAAQWLTDVFCERWVLNNLFKLKHRPRRYRSTTSYKSLTLICHAKYESDAKAALSTRDRMRPCEQL
ncbi:jg23101 [Pararge aegeria aegeria]|uniref:Jg23101 protein n=1 Tax=Pararge aegeria aegeria TaxID=348720 RepID=A0A8S4R3B4_9NEOP|nr:jg23101 [Pararge aegeria aegeria]